MNTLKCSMRHGLLIMLIGFTITLSAGRIQGAPENTIHPDVRCSICGMFVAKYEGWVTQIRLTDNSTLFFDGIKDMMVFYHNPSKYSNFTTKDIKEIWAKDYYSQQWINGFKAFYVVGSDVYGPMGKEFIPFAERAAAENFMTDHKGEKILDFQEITDELVQSLRSKMKMRHGSN